MIHKRLGEPVFRHVALVAMAALNCPPEAGTGVAIEGCVDVFAPILPIVESVKARYGCASRREIPKGLGYDVRRDTRISPHEFFRGLGIWLRHDDSWPVNLKYLIPNDIINQEKR